MSRTLTVNSKPYRIHSTLGEGAFSFVYLVSEYVADDDLLPTPPVRPQFALKVSTVGSESHSDARREISFLEQFSSHPNVVRLIDSSVVQKGSGFEISMLLEAAGAPLVEQMMKATKGIVPSSVGVAAFSDLITAVCALHAATPHPISHRDIKPENLLLGADGVWRLCDFGSASSHALFGGGPPPVMTKATAIMEGLLDATMTVAYRPPEACDLFCRERIDERTDVWACGVFLYYITHGRLPFEESVLAIARARAPDDTDDIPSGYPEGTGAIIRKALTRRAHRPSAVQLAREWFGLCGRSPDGLPDGASAGPQPLHPLLVDIGVPEGASGGGAAAGAGGGAVGGAAASPHAHAPHAPHAAHAPAATSAPASSSPPHAASPSPFRTTGRLLDMVDWTPAAATAPAAAATNAPRGVPTTSTSGAGGGGGHAPSADGWAPFGAPPAASSAALPSSSPSPSGAPPASSRQSPFPSDPFASDPFGPGGAVASSSSRPSHLTHSPSPPSHVVAAAAAAAAARNPFAPSPRPDPFASDPFGAPSVACASGPTLTSNDPFGAASVNDPFGSPPNDPFATDPFGDTSSRVPFVGSAGNPFASVTATSGGVAVPPADPFANSPPFASSPNPFASQASPASHGNVSAASNPFTATACSTFTPPSAPFGGGFDFDPFATPSLPAPSAPDQSVRRVDVLSQ